MSSTLNDGKRCGAKKRNGEPCGSWGRENGRCRMHGGNARRGLMTALPAGGRYSKHLPTRLLASYQEARDDPDLLAMRDDIALIDTRLSEVLARLQTGESPNAWLLLSGAIRELEQAARSAEEDEEPGEALEQVGTITAYIGELVRRALSEESAWENARSLVNQRMKLVESERKRMVDLQQMMTSEQAILLATALVATVKQHVTDRRILAAISSDVDRLLSRSDQGRALGGNVVIDGAAAG